MDIKLKNAYVQEVQYQTKMLNQLRTWLKFSIIFSSISLFLILFGPMVHVIIRYLGIILMIISVLASIVIGFGVKKGHDNISKIIDYIDEKNV